MYIPGKINELIAGMTLTIDTEGMSKAKVIKCESNKQTYYIKIENMNDEVIREYQMYHWLKGILPVPNIIQRVIENEISYLLLEKAEGKMLEDEEYKKNPKLLVQLAAKGIKALQSLDISTCTFDSTIDAKLKKARLRIDQGKVDKIDHNQYTVNMKTPDDVYQYLIENKPKEDLVLTHGDYCFNNLFTNGDIITSYIDMGRGGIGDRYQDIALCVRELSDYDPVYTTILFEILGVEPDYDKIKYYTLLDELF